MSLWVRDTEVRELMDDPDCDARRLAATFRRFGIVNRLVSGWGGVYRTQLRSHLASLARPARILDIGHQDIAPLGPMGGGAVAVGVQAGNRRAGLGQLVIGGGAGAAHAEDQDAGRAEVGRQLVAVNPARLESRDPGFEMLEQAVRKPVERGGEDEGQADR